MVADVEEGSDAGTVNDDVEVADTDVDATLLFSSLIVVFLRVDFSFLAYGFGRCTPLSLRGLRGLRMVEIGAPFVLLVVLIKLSVRGAGIEREVSVLVVASGSEVGDVTRGNGVMRGNDTVGSCGVAGSEAAVEGDIVVDGKVESDALFGTCSSNHRFFHISQSSADRARKTVLPLSQ